jgi:hypothetical protein
LTWTKTRHSPATFTRRMISSEWDKFRKQPAAGCEPLQQLASGKYDLLAKCRAPAPTEIEISA